MNYSLGNMLGGNNGSLNPDKLSLDLQFATDKTLTARKGPTPTFTRASTATFVGSNGLIQSAAVNAARFDHDPITLACKGLLIEESRTNLLLQSQTFGTTWTSSQLNTTGTPAYVNVATAPDGTTTADKLIATALLSTHQFRQSVTLVSGTVYSVTCYFKAAEQQFASIAAFGVANGSADWVSLFNISSSPATGTFNGFTSTSVTNAGNGWIRCTAVFTATASGSLEIRLGGASGTSGITPQIYLGDGTSGILVWGAQIEAGSFPTSYIPTTTASVVRSLDVCSISSIASFYGSGVGTIFTGTQLNGASQLNGVCGFFTGANQVAISRLLNNTRAVTNGNAPNLIINSGTLASTLFVKSAFAFNTNDAAFANNGVSAGTSTSVGIPSVTAFGIGTNGSQTMQSGTISEIKVFKKRLANAKLLTITT